jgi:fructose-1,6-bisphosphatase/inositol monophosphatase family enzyme
MLPDPDQVTAIIVETAVSIVLPRFQALAAHEVMEKNRGDLVTIADLEAEKLLEARLTSLSPGSVVVGEEAVHNDSTVLDRLASDAPLWIIDPVDGTANFAAGRPTFGIVVAYLEGSEVRAGWIHMPVAGTTAVAVRGEGAQCDGEAIHASSSGPLEEMRGLLNLGYFDAQRRDQIRERSHRFAGIETQRCAAHNYLSLATGGRHFSLYRRLWPWDHAAGVLIHAEAGGYSALLDGSPYRPTERSHGLLSAPSKTSWYAIHDYLLAD